MFASQPFLSSPSQSSKPRAQTAMSQRCAKLQRAVALGTLHALQVGAPQPRSGLSSDVHVPSQLFDPASHLAVAPSAAPIIPAPAGAPEDPVRRPPTATPIIAASASRTIAPGTSTNGIHFERAGAGAGAGAGRNRTVGLDSPPRGATSLGAALSATTRVWSYAAAGPAG